jgi:hypothetical protein
MRTFTNWLLSSLAALVVVLPLAAQAQVFTDVKNTTFEKDAIADVLNRGWMFPQTQTTFGYGVTITPDQWLYMLMFLRTSDACPELGKTANAYWTADNIRACLSGAGVPVLTERPDQVRRDEAMQQLFALRRQSFAFQTLQVRPAGFVDPADLLTTPANRQGAMIAADRLKLLFRSSNKLLPAAPLLREDAALSVWRFADWERQGGVDKETNEKLTLSKDAQLNHWRDLDTDIYVIQMKMGGDTIVKPIVPRRSFNPAKDAAKEKLRDEFVYQPVSSLAKESGAIAAINGSYFNVEWPWGAFEDVAMVDGKMILERTDRSTFIVCKDGKFYIGNYVKKQLASIKCTPEQMLGAGPLFLSKGEILTESTKEGFDEYTQWERRVGKNARTAVGISADRKTVYFIVVAGKSYPAFGRGGASLGTFLKEKYPDITYAMMYDGGGSSTLVAKGQLLVGMGVTGGDSERPVISALGLFSKKAEQTALAQFKKAQAVHWDKVLTPIKIEKPTQPAAWQTVKEAKAAGDAVTLSGSRGSAIEIVDLKKKALTFRFTFDLLIRDSISKLTLARREGTHEKKWKIPTELHILDPKDGSDTDVIRLFAYLPEKERPDLKTFDVVAFRPTGVVFGDATGRHWFYYTKNKQLSPAKFREPVKATPVKKLK